MPASPPGEAFWSRRNLERICHSEDGYAVRGNLPVGSCLYIGAYVAVQLYREIATGLPALAMTNPLVRRPYEAYRFCP